MIISDSVDPGGLGVNRQSTWKGSLKTLQGLPLTVLILGRGQSTVNLERVRKDFAMITFDSVDPGRVNQQSTWKGSEDFSRITFDSVDHGGGQSTVNLERIHKDFARITFDSVDPGEGGQSTVN